jgi:hypothetical protein
MDPVCLNLGGFCKERKVSSASEIEISEQEWKYVILTPYVAEQ